MEASISIRIRVSRGFIMLEIEREVSRVANIDTSPEYLNLISVLVAFSANIISIL